MPPIMAFKATFELADTHLWLLPTAKDEDSAPCCSEFCPCFLDCCPLLVCSKLSYWVLNSCTDGSRIDLT